MISPDLIRAYFPPYIREQAVFQKYMLKEYLQLLILDFLSSSPFVEQLVFIGGTHLRLVKGIDRFSEDLDFDCKNLTRDEFQSMGKLVINYLKRHGFEAESRDTNSPKLTAFRCNIYFPQLLFELGLTGHKEERFLIKLESQDQKIDYRKKFVTIKGCGFVFPFSVPEDPVLCSMKIAAMLDRRKGRDFYDVLFLMSFSGPDYDYLEKKCGISDLQKLKLSVKNTLEQVDLNTKMQDFKHLLFNSDNTKRILSLPDFFEQL